MVSIHAHLCHDEGTERMITYIIITYCYMSATIGIVLTPVLFNDLMTLNKFNAI